MIKDAQARVDVLVQKANARLDELARVVQPQRTVPAEVEFVTTDGPKMTKDEFKTATDLYFQRCAGCGEAGCASGVVV